MNIDIFTDFRIDAVFPENFFEELSQIVIENINFYPYDSAEISIVITDDNDMQTINNLYRRINKTTDVLSFPMNESKNIQMTMLGDVVISLDSAKRQANEADISVERELAFLFIHGLLHLLGYDHELGKTEEQEMFDLQEKILKIAIERGICK